MLFQFCDYLRGILKDKRRNMRMPLYASVSAVVAAAPASRSLFHWRAGIVVAASRDALVLAYTI